MCVSNIAQCATVLLQSSMGVCHSLVPMMEGKRTNIVVYTERPSMALAEMSSASSPQTSAEEEEEEPILVQCMPTKPAYPG
jgi:hypothetical protein